MNGRPALEHLLEGYFNLDWADDYGGDPMAAVQDFVTGEPQLSPLLAEEIRGLLRSEPSESALRAAVLGEFNCGYDPTEDGMTFREWLTSVAERVEQSLDQQT